MQAVIDNPKSLQRSGGGGGAVSHQDVPDAARPSGLVRESMIADSWISKSPERCGGDACIRYTRIPVWVLANYLRLGGTKEELLRNYASLTTPDIETALAYAEAHRNEIDRAIRENEEGESGPVE